MDVGRKLKLLREEKNLTIKELSNLSHVGQSTICEIETGKSKNPISATLIKLSLALNIELNLLLSNQK